ncbi:MAG: peptidase domain-containing ABC transporter [Saprospiraceae bacterium]|nr:peptidase domain-containing ABC transporter [Saprospiraceae bacterium]MDP4997553.1 peptidase domain-containing ABC transporter [Saprospiraceae bacterium]
MRRDFPFFQQLESMDCGPSCLRMVARYHGRYFSLEHLRELTQTGKQGVSLLEISDAAESLGMETIAAVVDEPTLFEQATLPLIAHWKTDHFVVVYRFNKHYVWIADPAFGKYKLKREVFLQHWKGDDPEGVVLMLQPGPEFHQQESHTQRKKGLERLFFYLKQYKSLLLQVFSGLLLGTVLQMVFLFLTVSFIDAGVTGVDPNFLGLALGAYLVLLFSAAVAGFIRNLIFEYIGLRVNIRLVSDFLARITRLPLHFFDRRHTNDVLQRMADHEKMQHFLASTTIQTAFAAFNLLAFSTILGYWNLQLLFIFAGGVLVVVFWMLLFQKRRKFFEYRKYDQLRQTNQQLVALVEGMQDIKMYDAEKSRRWAWERLQAKLIGLQEEAFKLEQWQRSGAYFLHETKNVLLLYVAATSVMAGEMSLGMLVGVQFMAGQLNMPLAQLLEFLNHFQDARLSLERMQELPEEQGVVSDKVKASSHQEDIILDNLSFYYPGSDTQPAIQQLSGVIERGKTTVVVGPSGSGKTTLMKLLLNLYLPSTGAVRVGEVNLRQMEERSWRQKCAWISGEGFIFPDTIAANIAVGTDHLDQRKLIHVTKLVNLQHFVEHLPLGYQTLLGEGGMGLSQGQKQRLLIARALYKDPDYLFFDEATNALDSFNEMLLMENVFDACRGKTFVLVTHQLPMVRYADRIWVLNEGELVEQGGHDELLGQGGAYYQLVKDQIALGK